MAHQQDRAVEFGQHAFHDLLRSDIQVIGWLVQDEQVSALQGEPGQCDAALLAAGKVTHSFEYVVAAKEESSQVIARFGDLYVLDIQYGVQYGLLQVQVGVGLGKIAYHHAGSETHASSQGGQLADGRLEKRRLA